MRIYFAPRLIHYSIACSLFALPFVGDPARAASPLTFVSGQGNDTGTCASPATPCRTFKFAYGQTSPGGEIKARNPADYGPLTITNSISITGVEGASIYGSGAITINAGQGDTVNITRLILNGTNTGRNGVLVNTGGWLTITNCTVRNYSAEGVRIAPTTGTVNFLIKDVVVSNSAAGVFAIGVGGVAKGTVDHVLAYKNGDGIFAGGQATLYVKDSQAIYGRYHGFGVGSGGILRLIHSASTGNSTGAYLASGSLLESAGDNFIQGNVTDVQGPLQTLPRQ